MKIEVTLSAEDFLAAQRLHFRPKPALRWTLYAALAVFLGMLIQQILILAQRGSLPRGWWVLPSGLGYGAFLFFILLPWRVRRIFRQNPGLAAPTRTLINEEGLFLESTRGQIRFQWPTLRRWKRNGEMILVYHSGAHFHSFPRRCFARPEDFDGLAELLGKHIGPAAL